MLGRVDAPMEQRWGTYSLKLKGLNREILITDTPGILEAGVAGTQRNNWHGSWLRANLLLFVNNDLRQSEYQPLRTLAEMAAIADCFEQNRPLYRSRQKPFGTVARACGDLRQM